MATLVGEASVRGQSETARMVLLTFAAIGITYVGYPGDADAGGLLTGRSARLGRKNSFTWGVEMTYCTAHLLKLGLSKSNTSLIWIAGPLSGLVVQPVVGVMADDNRSRWGRRRPLMAVGSVVVAAGLLVLGFTRELVALVQSDEARARRTTYVVAVLAIYVVDFAINVVQSCARSLVVDTLPLQRQQMGAAWASRMSALGHVVGYAAGSADLVRLLGSALGDSQFKQLTVIAALAMVGSTAVTCCAVTERVLVAPRGSKHGGFVGVLRQIHDTLCNLSPRIQAICWAQFWAWIGWFPFLFYSTTWVGETYFRYDAPADRRDARDALGDVGRIGSTSLLIYSAITTAGVFVLPLFVRSPDDSHFTHRPLPALAGLVAWVERHRPDLETTWQCAHVVFAASMFLAPLAQSFRFATALVCFCVLYVKFPLRPRLGGWLADLKRLMASPWTVATWAPLALLGIEINTMSGATASTAGYRPLPSEPVVELSVVQPSRDRREAAANGLEGTGKSGAVELSGIYFGILNIYTALPQFVGAFVASVVFAVLEPGGSPELAADSGLEAVTAADAGGPSAISACLFIGAICALLAAAATRKLKRL